MKDNKFDYYKAPPDEIFNEIKRGAIAVWKTKDDTYGYASEKIERIIDLENIKDNAWYIMAMFDLQNQYKVYMEVNEETQKAIDELFKWIGEDMMSD